MAQQGPAAERLRNEVRRRVRKDGDRYTTGAGARLAEAVGQDAAWVSKYLDFPPTRHANFDQALKMCALFRLDPLTLAPLPKAEPIHPLALAFAEGLRLLKDPQMQLLTVNTFVMVRFWTFTKP